MKVVFLTPQPVKKLFFDKKQVRAFKTQPQVHKKHRILSNFG